MKYVKVVAPLINGYEWMCRICDEYHFQDVKGPYSTWQGGPLYMLVEKEEIVAAYKRRRGHHREFLKSLLED